MLTWLNATMLTLVISTIIATLSYYFIEQPALAWVKNKRRRSL